MLWDNPMAEYLPYHEWGFTDTKRLCETRRYVCVGVSYDKIPTYLKVSSFNETDLP